MTSPWRHRTKFWDLFLQKLTVQSNIYRMVGWNKLNLKWFRSYSQLKMSNFGGRERDSRESGTVTFMHVCYSALAENSSGRFCSLWNFLRVLCAIVRWCFQFQWRSGALARAQKILDRTILLLHTLCHYFIITSVQYCTFWSIGD